jgi:hypothetical protein
VDSDNTATVTELVDNLNLRTITESIAETICFEAWERYSAAIDKAALSDLAKPLLEAVRTFGTVFQQEIEWLRETLANDATYVSTETVPASRDELYERLSAIASSTGNEQVVRQIQMSLHHCLVLLARIAEVTKGIGEHTFTRFVFTSPDTAKTTTYLQPESIGVLQRLWHSLENAVAHYLSLKSQMLGGHVLRESAILPEVRMVQARHAALDGEPAAVAWASAALRDALSSAAGGEPPASPMDIELSIDVLMRAGKLTESTADQVRYIARAADDWREFGTASSAGEVWAIVEVATGILVSTRGWP